MSELAHQVYKLLISVPVGKVTTYKALGLALHTNAYQAIGQILKRNPYAPIVPCHRVVASDGSIGGFNGKTKGMFIRKKISLLAKEGISVKNNRIENFTKHFYYFPYQTRSVNLGI